MITTNDLESAERLSLLRDHGSRKKYQCDLLGINSRSDSLETAVLLVKLKHPTLQPILAGEMPIDIGGCLSRPAWSSPLLCQPNQRDCGTFTTNLWSVRRSEMRCESICAISGYPRNLLSFPVSSSACICLSGYRHGAFPQSEAFSQQVLALPVFPQMTEELQEIVVHATAEFFSKRM
jgi:dTDP-4-amino-4,6-dideoxygalactose transaminase